MKQIKILLLMLPLIGCPGDKFDYDIIITETAINLGGLNSQFDDYNSDLPYPGQRTEILFSSNRNKGQFDIVPGTLDFSYHSKDKILNVSIPTNIEPAVLFPNVNTSNSELGPYSYNSGSVDGGSLFFYATNPNEKFEINFVARTRDSSSPLDEYSDPISLTGINSIGDNLYPSIGSDKKKLYFCSNRDNSSFNIYSAVYHSEISKESLVNNDIQLIAKEHVLSSDFDDKCPFVKDNFMVFASNRDGNFDLWYSKFENNNWSEPMKFDDRINSENNEYRPVIFEVLGFNLMIFSSDRPGGKGGYDLYIVKIDKYKKG